MTDRPKTVCGEPAAARECESSHAATQQSGRTIAGGAPSIEGPYGTVHSASDMEAVLIGWWKEFLHVESVSLDDDFFELGGDSLMGAQLFSRIEKTFGIELGLSTLFDARTVRQLAELIRECKAPVRPRPAAGSPIVAIQPSGSRRPLYVIPGGYGTTVLPFREVSLLLGPDQPVYGFEAKMPAPNEELESIPARAARFTKELRSLQPAGPYALFGWCGGGYIAFEMAQQLSREGQEVGALVIVECAVPGYPASWTGRMLYLAERGVWRIQNLLKHGPRGIARRVAARARALAKAMHLPVSNATTKGPETAIPPAPPRMDEMDERAWRNVERYRPTRYAGKSFLILGRDYWDYRGLSPSVDPRLAWRQLSQGGSDYRIVPGAHMDILRAPHSERLAKELKACLERSVPDR